MEKGKITSMTFKITNHLQNHRANFAQILHKTFVDDVDSKIKSNVHFQGETMINQ